MIKVFIPQDHYFKKLQTECKTLYQKVQDKICDSNSFEFIINNTFFYLFTDINNNLIGSIYYFVDTNGKLYLNGFAYPKKHNLNLECLKASLEWFNSDIYAEVQNRASALCLLRAGFKRLENNTFIYKH